MKTKKAILVVATFFGLLFFSVSGFSSTYLQGYLTANGSPYEGGNIYFQCSSSDGGVWASDWTVTDAEGYYVIDTQTNEYGPCGTYYAGTNFDCDLFASPLWDDSALGPSQYYEITLDCDGVANQDIALTPLDKTISITITAGGEPVTSGMTVYCSENEAPWTYAMTDSPTDGVYTMMVNAGNYSCNAMCSNNEACIYSGYPSAHISIGENDSGGEGELSFLIKDKTLRVSLKDTNGNTITSGMSVYASEQGGGWSYSSVDSVTNGKYVLNVGAATYFVSANCIDYSNCGYSGYPYVVVAVGEDDETVDITLTFLKNDSTVSGTVTDGSAGVANAGVSIYSYNVGSGSAMDWSVGKSSGKAITLESGGSDTTMVSSYVNTDENGVFQVRVPAGTYVISAYPPWDVKNLGQISSNVTARANKTTVVSLVLPVKDSIISGTVTDANGNGIANVNISGWSYSGPLGEGDCFWTQTDEEGNYTAYAIDGLKYNISADYWPFEEESSICTYNNEGIQSVLASSTPQTLNFTFPTCDCIVNLRAVDANGEIVSSIYGGVNATPANLDLGDSWYGIWGNLEGGIGQIKAQSNVEYTFMPFIWDENYVEGDNSTATCANGAVSVELDMLPLDATIRGSYLTSGGEAITIDEFSYIDVYSTKGMSYRNCDTTNSGFTCRVSEGKWCLGYWIDPLSGYASSGAGSSTSCVDITSGQSVTQNITLLKTGTINVSVADVDGSAMSNVWIEATPFSNHDHGVNEYQDMFMSNGCVSDSSGDCSVNVGAASGEGTIYYLNAYIPYYTKLEDNLINPQEISVTVVEGESVTADTLTFMEPDGTSVITVSEGSAAPMLTFGKSVPKLLKVSTDEVAASPIENATIDCFAVLGASFQVSTDASGVATCPCSTQDEWKAVAYSLIANNLWMSEVADITCTETGGVGSLTMNNVATVPEGKSMTISNAASQSLTIELSDSFSVFFPQGSLGGEGEQVTCTVDVTMTPFTANRRPASFYGYSVNCQGPDGADIVQLNSNATFTVPVNQGQVENVGLTLDSINMDYYDDTLGAYSSVGSYTVDDDLDVITYQQNHLADYMIVGNGNLAGVNGEEAGEGANEYGDGDGDNEGGSSASSGGGCNLGADLPARGNSVVYFMILLPIGLIFARGVLLRSPIRRR